MPPTEPLAWSFVANVADSVCYAMAHNRTPIVHSLKITGLRETTGRHLIVHVGSAWAREGRPPLPEARFSIEAPRLGETVEISPVSDARLDDIALADLETAVPAEITIEISDEAGHSAKSVHETTIYARNQWLNSPTFVEVTAAFVQPNHPDVQQILSGASRRLTARGESGSISGYQEMESGQHHLIAQAIFEELQTRIANYINPPATYESIGQLVRPLDQVLQERQGTCIDLACAYASCLEAAGLYPVIFMVTGHAFSGYISKPEHLNRTYIDTWPEIQNLIDSKLIVGVETIAIPTKADWDTAKAATSSRLTEGQVEGVLDVLLTHRSGVRPLPVRMRRGDELVIVIDNGPSEPAVIERRDPTTRKLLADSVPARVQAWKNGLLDLSFRNRLLNLNVQRSGVRLLPPLGQLGNIEDRLTNGEVLQLAPSDLLNAVQLNSIPDGKERTAQNLGDELWLEALNSAKTIFSTLPTDPFRARINRLRSDARLQEEESGANNLYLALGSVKWGDTYGDFASPIFLIPLRMRLGRGDRIVQISMDETQSTVPNYCLVEALRARERLTLPWFSDDMSDDFGLDVEVGLQNLRTEFRERGLDARGFTVELSASLATLDFKKFRLWRDLSENWKEFAKRPIVKHLIETPRLTFEDPAATGPLPAVDDSTLLTPQPADGSQIRAIARSLAGHSFVLEGPPGTGKSQTITNLLANAMYQGKKVLFVAEKQAALAVVHERLEQVGLGPYCLQLHDRGTKPEALRKQLQTALEHRPFLDERAQAQLEEEFSNAARQLDQYRRGLYEPNEAGFSFASAHEALVKLGVGEIADVPRSAVAAGKAAMDDVRRRLLAIADLTVPAQVRPNHPWSLAGAIGFDAIDRARLAEVLAAVAASVSPLIGIADVTGELLHSAHDHDDLHRIAAVLELVEQGTVPKQSDWPHIGSDEWVAANVQALTTLRSHISVIESMLPGNQTVARRSDLTSVVQAVAEAAQSFAIGRKGRVRTALGELLPFLAASNDIAAEAPRWTQAVAQASAGIRASFTSLVNTPGTSLDTTPLPVTLTEVEAISDRFHLLHLAAELVLSSDSIGSHARTVLANPGFPQPGMAARVTGFADNLATLVSLVGGDLATERRWTQGISLLTQTITSINDAWNTDRDSGTYLRLQRWLTLQQELAALRAVDIEAFSAQIETGTIQGDNAANAFERGLLMTTMKIRAEEMNLDVFDRVQQDRRVKHFIELLDRRRDLAKEAIPFGLSRGRKVQSGINVGKVGDFRREVSRPGRGRGKSIRHLITMYPEIVSDLTPCFLMSPDSVAQFVPPGTIDFDVAVFDEASQVTVADSIGILGRATSVVIVGDSRQMPPTRVGVAGSGEDEDAAIEDSGESIFDEESILEEALQAGFDQEWLSWHYRSQDESLIAFSNSYYYESRLATFPSPADSRPDCGIFYRRVDGQFDHGSSRTNRIEAAALIEEVVKRLDDPTTTDLTFGIITLNLQQRHLIESLLDNHSHPKVRELRDTEDPERRLFVLNLENVQGRERDVIVLGTAFSKKADGSAMPLNFGPLTNKGGEKRLNVAVTRARRQFVVVSSFDPSEMRDPTSLGMLHLRDYLARAKQGPVARTTEQVADSAPTGSLIGELAERLRSKGLRVSIRRGMSTFKVDLALSLPETPDRWLVAVLIDGPEWSERPLVADRDALPTVILKQMMGWPRVARVWLPSWLLEPDEIVADLVELVRQAATEPDPEPAPAPTPPPVAHASVGAAMPPAATVASAVPPPPPAMLAGQEMFTALSDPGILGTVAYLEAYHRSALALAIQIVEAEGPIPAVNVVKRVANAFGLSRVANTRLNTLWPLVAGMATTELGFGSFLWSSSKSSAAWRGFRLTTSEQRTIADIAPEELINYMEAVTRVSFGIEREQLLAATAAAFGNKRLTDGIRGRIDGILDVAIATNRLLEDGTITVP